MAANTTYQTTDYTAFSVAKSLKKSWTPQVTSANPLLACIENGKSNWRKGYKIRGLSALLPIVYTDISAFNTATAGIADADEIPTAWPAYDATEGFSQAEYDFTHVRRSMTIKDSERELAVNGERGDLLEGKKKQLMNKFKTIFSIWIEGNQNSSRQQLLGIEHAINTANTVGGINQALAANEFWRATVTGSVGTLALSDINDAYDRILRHAGWTGDQVPADLLLLSFNGSSNNVFSRMRELIDPAERYHHHAGFTTKYGIANFNYMGLKCVMSNRMTAETAALLSTSSWYYGGYASPRPHERIRIPNSDAYEYLYSQWSFIGCDEPRRNEWMSGITG